MAKKPNPFAKIADKKLSPKADAAADAKLAKKADGKGKVPGNRLKAKPVAGSMKDSLSGTVPGAVNKSLPAKPIPGPTSPGQPVAMKKALARKAVPSKGL